MAAEMAVFTRTAQQSVLDGTNGLFKLCAHCRIVHRADIFAIVGFLLLLMLVVTYVTLRKLVTPERQAIS